MATVITVRPDRTWSVDEITDNSRGFLKEVYALIGNGCDFVQAVNVGDGLFMLVDEEPFRRDPIPPSNPALVPLLRALDCNPARIQGAVVFVGETPSGDDLAGLSSAQVTELSITIAGVTT